MNDLIFVSFDGSKTDSRTLASKLDSQLELQNWFTVFNNGLLLETEASAKEVSEAVQSVQKGLNVICIHFDPADASGLLPLAVSREIANRRK